MKKKLLTIALSLAAVALSMSSATASYTDMNDSEASVLMSRLGIMSGYEDGAFRPEKTVTRAEAATAIVRAIGYGEEEVAGLKAEMLQGGYIYNAGSNVFDFSDCDQNHWALPYLQLALENNIISGFTDETLRPNDPVTIEQLITMLVRAVGYDTYAQASGGYPYGYIQWADAEGITMHLDAADYKQNAIRDELLLLIDNTVKTPLCVIKGYETTWDGRITPELEMKDGTGKDFQTLLTRRFDIYTAAARVTSVKDKYIECDILRSQNFADNEINESTPINIKTDSLTKSEVEQGKLYRMYIRVNDIDSNDYELVYACNATE